jgi:hypothetical protein
MAFIDFSAHSHVVAFLMGIFVLISFLMIDKFMHADANEQ